MTPITSFVGKTVAVFGLGNSGAATAFALRNGGCEVICFDDDERAVGIASGYGLRTANLRAADWKQFDALVLSPGIPLTHPKPHWTVERARAAGIPVIGDIELFCLERAKVAPGSPFIAITGTNGKSTTTALIAHILAAGGTDVQMGGNIGAPVLTLEAAAPGRVHVVECSSFQIDLAPSLDPTIGIHLNLTPDHLDRHGSMENYAAIKERLVAKAGTAIIGVDDALSKGFATRRAATGAPLWRISAEGPVDEGIFAGVTANDGVLDVRLVRVEDKKPRVVANLAGIGSLRGMHNAQNAAAAFAACSAMGLADPQIADALKTFPGLPHRMEEIARKGRVIFINDSKATNADSTEKALTSFRNIFWIVGGKAKDGGIEPLRRFFPNIVKAYLIGAASDDFARTLEGAAAFELCGTIDKAVASAARDAASHRGVGEVCVLLSPACASYDQFQNFEHRGDVFRKLVAGLP
ncbi:MAG: UDP-N-acetylmuramoyl-L-alanine--D-glutamate ligase [Bosea sp.]|jgi:UDP-N-acetylmuramoylalanine--D-glutamate ligase|nr:UDP-N-acetylmuramoyl-L-alanine--D-glutamate ligase [Bosea sp. (in: a-proteobacteria)]